MDFGSRSKYEDVWLSAVCGCTVALPVCIEEAQTSTGTFCYKACLPLLSLSIACLLSVPTALSWLPI